MSELNSTGEKLSEAMWEAAWFAVRKQLCGRDEFVALMTKAAEEAFDSQMSNAKLQQSDFEDVAKELVESGHVVIDSLGYCSITPKGHEALEAARKATVA
jgi:hypothetical protein